MCLAQNVLKTARDAGFIMKNGAASLTVVTKSTTSTAAPATANVCITVCYCEFPACVEAMLRSVHLSVRSSVCLCMPTGQKLYVLGVWLERTLIGNPMIQVSVAL